VIEPDLKAHDIVALVPIVEGAGGIVTCWDGGSPARGGDVVASCNGRIHEEALSLLNG
jgi:myo-inositol-1(or 4)-monophosphatase